MEGLSSLDEVILNEPDQRFILSVILKDKTAFSALFIQQILNKQELLQPHNAPNLGKALMIYRNLVEKRMVYSTHPFENKISWKGKLYLIYTHPSLTFWGIILGIIITVWIGMCTNNVSKKESNQQSIPKNIKSIYDSLLYHQKKDTSSANY